MNLDLPKGIRAFTPEESFQIEYIKNAIISEFEKWGYDSLILPQIEYFDVHRKGIGKELENKTFRLIDRAEGEIITLRADFTAQIARYVASLRKKEFPLRFYYYGNLFRYVPPKADNLWERKQTGIELIGVKELIGDAEVIAVASKSLENLGIKNYQIDINNIKIFTVLRKILGLSEEDYTNFMNNVRYREIYYLKQIAKEVQDSTLKEFVVNIPKIQGDVEILSYWKEKLSDYPELVSAIDELQEIKNILENFNLSGEVIFDLGEPREFSYYTGIVFEVVISDFSKPLAQGGRYDNLLKRYDGDIPATGFAFNLINLWSYISKKKLILEKKEKDFYVLYSGKLDSLYYEVINTLRIKGYSVFVDVSEKNIENAKSYIFSKGFKNIIFVDTDKKSIYIYSKGGSSEVLNLEEFLKKFH